MNKLIDKIIIVLATLEVQKVCEASRSTFAIKCKYWAAGSHLDKNKYPRCFVSNGYEYPLCKGGKFLRCNVCNLHENFGEEN